MKKSFVAIRETDEDGESILIDIPVDKVEFLNIEEDIQGRDVMTFSYKGREYKSFVFVK